MPASTLFISYSHRDMQPFDWMERLKLYLAPSRQEGVVEIWDDSRIEVGSDWRNQITVALRQATSAILLVGPAFLASDFIRNEELPVLLEANETRGCRIYPLVVAYCAYVRSILSKYQAFNNPDAPLEALHPAEQNKLLNRLSMDADKDLRRGRESPNSAGQTKVDMQDAMREIAKQLENTRTAFVAQCHRRDLLVQTIKKRVKVDESLQYEKFFFRYFEILDREEKFQFEQIRAITEGPLCEGNKEIYNTIERHPEVLERVPALANLRQHLVFWLNKYEKVFAKRPEMCVLYTGVEDGVPFPPQIDKQVRSSIRENR